MYLSYMQQKNETRARAARVRLLANLYLHPQPLEGATWGRFGRDLFISTKKAAPLDCFSSLSGIRDSSPRCARAIARELYLHPQPLEGANWGRFVQVIVSNEKSSPFGLLLRLSGKRDSSPRCARAIARELYLHPRPLKGASGVASCKSSCQTKKAVPLDCFSSLSGKRDSNSRPQPWQGCALPTELFPQVLWLLSSQTKKRQLLELSVF